MPESEKILNKILKPGQTSRADILLQWGPPSKVFEEDKFFVYEWKRIRGYIAWAIGGPPGGIGWVNPWTAEHYLCLEFDSENVLKQFRVFERQHLNPLDKPYEHMLEWIKTGHCH